jgi:ribonuclease III
MTFADRLGWTFKSSYLLQQALTHRSYHNENPQGSPGHYERLEFLGDAVLELILSETLFLNDKKFDEGQMSKIRASLVNEKTLAEVAQEIGLDSEIRLGRGEIQAQGASNPRLLSSVLEALVGALYLDGGLAPAAKFVRSVFTDRLQSIHEAQQFDEDFKTKLQEISQSRFRRIPVYEVTSAEGPDHSKVFRVRVTVDGQRYVHGEGRSKKQAEQSAAERALKELL